MLITKYQEIKDEEIFKEILKKYENLIYKIICEYKTTILYEKEDLYQVGMISLVKAINNFEIGKEIKFSTFLTTIVRNDMNILFRKTKKRTGEVKSLDEEISNNNEDFKIRDILSNGENIEKKVIHKFEKEWLKENLKQYKKKYPKKAMSIELILKGYTFRKCEKMLPYGRQSVSNYYNHFIKYLEDIAIKEGMK